VPAVKKSRNRGPLFSQNRKYPILLPELDDLQESRTMPPATPSPDDQVLAAFCRAHGIRHLSIFGSTIKGTARPDSDLDLLVEFEPDRVPGLLGMAKLEEELSALMGGKTIDLRTPGDLSRYFRDDVLRTARTRYAA